MAEQGGCEIPVVEKYIENTLVRVIRPSLSDEEKEWRWKRFCQAAADCLSAKDVRLKGE
jgi:hypothetical protein